MLWTLCYSSSSGSTENQQCSFVCSRWNTLCVNGMTSGKFGLDKTFGACVIAQVTVPASGLSRPVVWLRRSACAREQKRFLSREPLPVRIQTMIRRRFPNKNDTVKILPTDRFVFISLDDVGKAWEVDIKTVKRVTAGNPRANKEAAWRPIHFESRRSLVLFKRSRRSRRCSPFRVRCGAKSRPTRRDADGGSRVARQCYAVCPATHGPGATGCPSAWEHRRDQYYPTRGVPRHPSRVLHGHTCAQLTVPVAITFNRITTVRNTLSRQCRTSSWAVIYASTRVYPGTGWPICTLQCIRRSSVHRYWLFFHSKTYYRCCTALER